MKKNDSNIRKIVRKAMLEANDLTESDLLAKAGLNWDSVKPKLVSTVNSIINNIDTDDYAQADKLIGSAMAMLKIWRAKIHKGQDMVNRVPHQWTLDEIKAMFEGENLNEEVDLSGLVPGAYYWVSFPNGQVTIAQYDADDTWSIVASDDVFLHAGSEGASSSRRPDSLLTPLKFIGTKPN